MARPAPQILAETQYLRSTWQVLRSTKDILYLVLYDNKPFSLRTTMPSCKWYARTSFTNKISATKMAITLNKRFDTDKFSVKECRFSKAT